MFDWRCLPPQAHQRKVYFSLLCCCGHSSPIKFIQQFLFFFSLINHFFICWPPTNLKKWIERKEKRADEFNGAACSPQEQQQLTSFRCWTVPLGSKAATKTNKSIFPFSKRRLNLFCLLLMAGCIWSGAIFVINHSINPISFFNWVAFIYDY